MKSLKDKWLRIVGIPIASGIIAFGAWLWEPTTHAVPFILHFFIIAAVVLSSWHICRILLIRTRRKYPDFKESLKRLPISLVKYSAVLFCALGIQILFIDAFDVYKTKMGFQYWMKEYIISLVTAYIVAGIYEARYFFEQWVDNEKAAERLKIEAMHSQLESLKNQVKPHFLFNSLNSLMALIDEDKRKAKKFLQELSRVYRYLLQSNEKQLVSLSDELEFTDAYFYLLKTRFEDGLLTNVRVNPEDKELLLPPLTLQMLIENAVKHNRVDKESPLTVTIYSDEVQNLIVLNNLQKKNSIDVSTGMGMANISAKYKLLNQPDIAVKENSKYFKVTIPLIKNHVT